MSTNNNNTAQQSTVISSYTVCKPGRTKFVPSVVKKQQESTPSSSTQDKQDESTVKLNIDLVNSTQNPPENPVSSQQKITMAYYLKDRKEGIPMINSPVPKKGPKSGSPTPQPPKPVTGNNNRSMSSLVAPQIKLVDGKVVLDDSLLHSTISHSQLAQEMSVINETDRHLTSATFAKKRVTSNRWSPQESNLFFEAVRMCGTDFSMIESLLPHRNRSQIKGKYKIEERTDPGRLYKALDNPMPYDPKFTEKVAQILSEQNQSPSKNK